MGTETEIWPRLKWYTIRFGSMTIDRQPYYNDTPCPHEGFMDGMYCPQLSLSTLLTNRTENPTGPLCLLSTNSHLLTPLLTPVFLAMRSMPALKSFDLNIGTRIDVQFRGMICWSHDVPMFGGNLKGERGFFLTPECFQGLDPPTNPNLKNHAISVGPAVIDAMTEGLRAT